jgi:hypothetical protein
MKGALKNIGWQTLLLLVFLATVSCEKDPGKGGLATVQGKVYVRDVNALGVVHDSGYGGGIRVMIAYGDNSWVDNDVRTSFTGDYAFKGLQKGLYTLSVYSRCDTCLLNQTPFTQSVEVTETRQVATVPDFEIFQ